MTMNSASSPHGAHGEHEHEHVLPTLEADGTRVPVRPRQARGRFYRRRRVVAVALIAAFLLLPYITIGGRPAMLLDLGAREFSFFGAVFRPSDTISLMFFGLTIAFAIVLVTALWGRVWCGWACPQTVWLEWVFRPIERFFEGSPAQQRALDARGGWSWRRFAKFGVYLVLAFVLANTFLSYFVGASRVASWVRHSPAEHPVGFAVVVVTTALMFFDFAYFREQTCTFACPYGRFQSVLIDRQSMIVAYDDRRGEPRGRRRKLAVISNTGDCVDCGACVQACPTGIDIRKGLQMECVGCAQCVDACDAVMDKLQQPRGLIRYTSKAELVGESRKILRARTIVYPVLLAAAFVGLLVTIGQRSDADVWLEKTATPYEALEGGMVSTPVELRLENRTGDARRYTITLDDPAHAQVAGLQKEYKVGARETSHIPFFVLSPATAFDDGRRDARILVRDDAGWSTALSVTLLGPEEHEAHGGHEQHEAHEHEGGER
jgi:cytochrome c oxidase accessory protein FixG